MSYSNFKIKGGLGYQNYEVNGTSDRIEYDPNGTNTEVFDNGIGTSMNVVNDVTSGLHMTLLVEGNPLETGYVSFRGSYQHATSSVTLAQLQNYTLSSNGLVGVINFNSSVRNKYDAMQGVSGSFYGRNICYVSP